MSELVNKQGKFGTAPVFLTAISTILGAIMFLRFGWAVGHVGLWATLGIIIIGHLVTIPTAMALAEIATNQKVEGGGEYYIISRSFGLTIGAAIGLALYLSQAISVAFYTIAFTEAFSSVFELLQTDFGISVEISKRLLGVVSIGLLAWLMSTKGANTGMWMLYAVVAILGVSLVMFFAGTGTPGNTIFTGSGEVKFFTVFAVVFPAFTGMTAGVGLSGDLKDPKKSIPQGTMIATLIGMVIYILIAIKLAVSAPTDALINTDKMVMTDIAIWGPIIPIGLAAATISSALGSVMVAPRTLNAIALDKIVPIPRFNNRLGKIKPKTGEPVNASLVTCGIALLFVLMGDVNAVAEIISMFFMVTYGSICLISLLENFASNPGYRPSFKSKWYISLVGAVMCIFLMFKINPLMALLSIGIMVLTYWVLSKQNEEQSDMASIFSGVIFQISRNLHVFLQKRKNEESQEEWRPSVVAVSKDSFDRHDEFDLLRWISHRKGFGMFVHHIDGYLSKETSDKAKDALKRLIRLTQVSKSSVFMDTIINPTYKASISQILQLPGVSGKNNNMVLFEFYKTRTEALEEIIEHYGMVKAVGYDTCILCSSEKKFGFNNEIHIWITSNDYQNANLMIYLAYIILGHPDWNRGFIKLFAIYPESEKETQRQKMLEMIKTGRLPISANNIDIVSISENQTPRDAINKKSKDADLTIVGFRHEAIKKTGISSFLGYDGIGNVLFVNSQNEKEIV
ncbi:MAG: amino acid permease [Flavobacteriales bacterium]|nr:amino acid permease [Flavobacteriales bacterium]